MAIEVKFKFASGGNAEVMRYFSDSRSGAIKVADKPIDAMGYDIYHFCDSTVRFFTFMDKDSCGFYADERIQIYKAISKLEEATNVKLEKVK